MPEIKFKETEIGIIPEDWEVVELGEVCDILTGFPFKGNKYSNKGVKVLRGENVSLGFLRWNTEKRWNEGTDGLDKYFLNENDIVIGMDGSRVGKNKSIVTKKDLPLLLAQRVARLRGKYNLYQKYLRYCIISKLFKQYVEKIKTGTSIPHISGKQIYSFLIPLPPLPEQKAIAEVLSSLDDKIELLEKQNQTLENIGQAIFKSWFVDFEPFQNDLVESEMGMIPRGWKVGKIGDIIKYKVDNRGKTPKTIQPGEDGVIPMIEINSLIGKGRNINIELIKKGVNEEIYNTWFRKGHPEKGDVLFSTVGSIGEIGLMYNEKICIAQNIVSLRPNVGGEFLYELLKYIKPNLLSLDISTVQPSIKLPHLLNFEILIPPVNIIDSFILKIKDISEKINKNKIEIQTLTNLRNTLLPRLMNGKIRVKF